MKTKKLFLRSRRIASRYCYCTKCNAVLDEQAGFEKNDGTWECAVCGQLLIGDTVRNPGKKYQNVMWYCDECGDLLNNQADFDDRCKVWKCKECGYNNSIAAEEIFNSKSEYYEYEKRKARTYKCAQCGGITHGPNCEYCGCTLNEFMTD